VTPGPVDAALLHDIGHEVATLSALVAAVRSQGAFDDATAARIALLEQEIDRLLDLVGACASWPGPDEVADEIVDLRELLRDVVVGRGAASPGTVVLCPGPSLLVRLERHTMRRLMTNLVDNAVRASGPAGVVEVGLDGGVDPVVRVADDGPGPGRGPKGDHGLGLAIVSTLARQLEADVTLRPRAGGGAVAEIVLWGRGAVPVPPPREGQPS
jgi:signal transduction histidine kinase